MAEKFDVIVIGAGPGGYVCAIRCAQLGMKVACVEKRDTLGGTCLNVGCIPSKALLSVSEKYEDAAHHMGDVGIKIKGVSADWAGMQAHKNSVVEANTKGIEFLFKKNKITHLNGWGKIAAPGQVDVNGTLYSADNIIIATGSDVASLPGITIDEERIVSSTGALTLKDIPKSMVVIGGGVIGLELGAVYNRLGTEVTVVEFQDAILAGMDGECQKEMLKIMKRQGLEFMLSSKVKSAENKGRHVELTVEAVNGSSETRLKADVVLVAVGRTPYTAGLSLEKVGVKLDERGRIEVDEFFESSVEGIYAIGDVIRGAMLAHKAEDEGVVLAEMLAGESGHIDYDSIPGVVYTWPEVAGVGKTEEALKADGIAYHAGKFPFLANGRARAIGQMDGFVKILACAKTDKILGAHIVGPNAGDLMQEIITVKEFDGTAEDIARTCHAHPTLSEVVKEAALAVHKRALHN